MIDPQSLGPRDSSIASQCNQEDDDEILESLYDSNCKSESKNFHDLTQGIESESDEEMKKNEDISGYVAEQQNYSCY